MFKSNLVQISSKNNITFNLIDSWKNSVDSGTLYINGDVVERVPVCRFLGMPMWYYKDHHNSEEGAAANIFPEDPQEAQPARESAGVLLLLLDQECVNVLYLYMVQ